MKKILYIMALSFFVLPASLFAEEKNCVSFEEEINNDIAKLGGCWRDEDCDSEYFGCPWQKTPCHRIIISKSEQKKNEAVHEKLNEFSKQCVDVNEVLAEKCKKYEESVRRLDCSMQKLMCVNGKCVNQNAIMLHGEGEGVDVFGSRAIIEREQ